MATAWRGTGRISAAGMAALTLAACGSTHAPTAAEPVAAAQVQGAASGVVRGLVVDSASRPVAGANVECASNAHCRRYSDVSTQDGIDEGVKTDAHGFYQLIVTPSGTGGFLLNASARGFGVAWSEVQLPDAACSWSQSNCVTTLNFTLSPSE